MELDSKQEESLEWFKMIEVFKYIVMNCNELLMFSY